MNRIKALAIDFDGVLADTIQTHTAARVDAFQQLSYDVDPALHNEAHQHGAHSSEIIGWILKSAGIVSGESDAYEDQVVHRVVELKKEIYFEQAAKGLNATIGSLSFVAWATEKYGADKMAIATTASRQSEVLPFLRRHGIERSFNHIVAQEDTPKGKTKPHPYVYEEAVRQLGCRSSSTAAIEDTPRGIFSAQASGLFTFGIATTHPADSIIMADRVVEKFEEIKFTLSSSD